VQPYSKVISRTPPSLRELLRHSQRTRAEPFAMIAFSPHSIEIDIIFAYLNLFDDQLIASFIPSKIIQMKLEKINQEMHPSSKIGKIQIKLQAKAI
jgi:hypothetical protein